MSPENLEARIGQILSNRGKTLAAAESCTGGLVSHRITNIPGSSDYFVGGVVAYSNATKIAQLGVQAATLERYGAVSEETVVEMARGVRLALRADIGISVSGIAGPGGGSPNKPVGLTWIGLDTANQSLSRRNIWAGTRVEVKEQTAEAALHLLLEFLEGITHT